MFSFLFSPDFILFKMAEMFFEYVHKHIFLGGQGYAGSEQSKKIKRQRNTKTEYFKYIIKNGQRGEV